jgi:nucleoside-diphosphate-sugar epimerase
MPALPGAQNSVEHYLLAGWPKFTGNAKHLPPDAELRCRPCLAADRLLPSIRRRGLRFTVDGEMEMGHYLVTGGAGFIGSHLTEALVKQNHQVTVLDNLSSSTEGNLAAVSGRIQFIRGDIRDRAMVRRSLQTVECVIHLAAWRGVPKSMHDAYGYTEVNVLGTAGLLEAAVEARVRRFVCISSSSVYGNADSMPLREDMPCRPVSPYAASKLASEVLCGSFSRSFDLETVCLRYFNVFGPRQRLEGDGAVMPRFISCLINSESPTIDGDGRQSRDFTYVDNVVDATLLASHVSGISGQVFNVGLGEERTILDLLQHLNQIFGSAIRPRLSPNRLCDVRRTVADSSKAASVLNWKRSVSFDEGLVRTVEYFQANPPRTG